MSIMVIIAMTVVHDGHIHSSVDVMIAILIVNFYSTFIGSLTGSKCNPLPSINSFK